MTKNGFEKKLRDAMEEKRQIEERTESITQELSRMNVQGLKIQAGDARARLESFIRLNGESESRVPESRRAELASLKSDAEEKVKASRQAKEKDRLLREELEDLKSRLAQFEYFCTDEEVRGYLNALEKEEHRAAELRHAIAEQEAAVRKAEEQIPTLGDLPRQREDLLADIATGQAVEADLKKIDEEIQKQKAAISQAKGGQKESRRRPVQPSPASIASWQRSMQGGPT